MNYVDKFAVERIIKGIKDGSISDEYVEFLNIAIQERKNERAAAGISLIFGDLVTLIQIFVEKYPHKTSQFICEHLYAHIINEGTYTKICDNRTISCVMNMKFTDFTNIVNPYIEDTIAKAREKEKEEG